MTTLEKCPNCIQIHDTISDNSVCLLHACVAVIVNERQGMTAEQGQALLQSTDVEAFWSALGPVIDQLRDGAFRRQINYAVRWEIDIVARAPTEAAEMAQRIQRDPNSSATFFEVAEVADVRASADARWTLIELPVVSALEETRAETIAERVARVLVAMETDMTRDVHTYQHELDQVAYEGKSTRNSGYLTQAFRAVEWGNLGQAVEQLQKWQAAQGGSFATLDGEDV